MLPNWLLIYIYILKGITISSNYYCSPSIIDLGVLGGVKEKNWEEKASKHIPLKTL